jgi:hypothetical protein
MKRFLAFLLFLTPLISNAATGDIIGAEILPQGWILRLTIEGLNTNGTYNFNLATNNNPINANGSIRANSYLDLVSQGYDSTAQPTTISRRVFGTHALRFPTPNNTLKDEVISGGNVLVKIALSEGVFAGDSNVVATIKSGLYVESGVSNAATTITVTNNSTLQYPDTVGQWTDMEHQRITSTDWPVRCVAVQAFAQEGRPVAVVKFIATDQHSHSVTNIISEMTIDRSKDDPYPLSEYIANMDLSSMTALDDISFRFIAYPWVGTNVLDTRNIPAGIVTSLANQTNVYDPSNTFGVVYCLVDPTNGSDSTGIASTNQAAALASPVATGAIGLWVIEDVSKKTFSRTNTDAGMLYVTNGTTTLFGSTALSHSGDRTWLTVSPCPGADPSQCVVKFDSTRSNRQPKSKFVKYENLILTQTFDSDAISGSGSEGVNVWLDHCAWNGYTNGTVAPVANAVNALATFSTLDCNTNATIAPLRGCIISGVNSPLVQERLFSTHITSVASTATITETSVATNTRDNIVYANCFFSQQAVGLTWNTGPKRYGFALLNDVFETSGETAQPMIGINADSDDQNTTNGIIFNCTFEGQRDNLAYNDSGTNAVWAINWHIKNSVFYYLANKNDTFGTANSNRIGNWSFSNGVGFSGNVNGVNDFDPEFDGLNSTASINSGGDKGWVHDASSRGDGTGNGNYRVLSSSPLATWNCEWLLPYDITGEARSAIDPPGAYASASPRKGAAFFGW